MKQVLLFLDQRADGTLRVMHLYLGKFSIVTDPASGDLVAVRPLPEEVDGHRAARRGGAGDRAGRRRPRAGGVQGTHPRRRPARPGR